MNTASTSLAEGQASDTATEPEWRRVARFIRRPDLNEEIAPVKEGIGRLFQLYLIDAVLMIGLAIIASAVLLSGVEIPNNTLEDIPLSPGWIAVIIIGAPLTEEILFRSWLSGKPGHLIAALVAFAVLIVMPLVPMGDADGTSAWRAAIIVGGALAAFAAAFGLRRYGPMGWFRSLFPAIFWLATFTFAAVHLVNYETAGLLILLPLVIPQFVAGTLFGYARVKLGLWAAMVLHGLHNASAVTVMLIGQSMADKTT
ncbi:MAG: CPBP family glutamic-type intramembrane protease [Pseudomonadota bacterium]|nr:CPBP family glutamic-type intramembrane protease [Pseudomonadota bacterium]